MKKSIGILCMVLIIVVLATSLSGCSKGDAYPNKAIDLVVPASAGSGGDVLTRVIAKYLGEELGVSINVVNTGGGGGIPAVQSVLSANADGYTLLADQALSSSYQYLLEDLPYKVEERTYICRVGKGPQVLNGSAKLGWKDLNDVSKYIKENPDGFLWGGIGKSSAANFAVLQFMKSANVDINKTKELRYKGGGEILSAIAGGHVLLGSCAASGVPSFAESGKVTPLCVAGSSRLALLPDVKCAAEQGFPEFTVGYWVGISGPKGLPDEIVKTIDDAIQKLVKSDKFVEDLGKIGVVVDYAGPEQFLKDVIAEGEEAKDLVKLADN